MQKLYTRHFAIAFVCAALLLFTNACTPAEGNNEGEHEEEYEPSPDDNAGWLINLGKSTSVTFLTDVTEIGYFGGAGRVTCMVIDKADSNHFVAGAETGGLWSSHDRGHTWQVIDDQLPSLSIRSISQNPFQTNIYYASTNTSMLAGTQPNVYRPDIYKSTDGGQTFQLLPATAGTFGNVLKVVCSTTDPNTVYALSNNLFTNDGLYRSQDGGQTFSFVYPIAPNNNVTDVEVFPDGSVLLSAGTEVVRSPNGNLGTFTPVNGLNGVNTFTNIDFAFCQSQPGNVYGVSTGGNSGVGVFRSVDGGQNWSFLQSLATGIFTRTIGVKPDNPAYFFAGSVGLYISQNSGGAFAFYGVGGVDWWSVNFDPHNPDKVFMTFDQGIVEVGLNPFNPNNNTAYIRRDTLLNCAQIYAGDYFPFGDRVMTGMQDLGTRMGWPGGERNVGSGDGGFCFYHKQDTTIGYAEYQNGRIYKKTALHIPFPQTGFTQPFSIMNELDADNDDDIDEGAFFIHPFWVNNANGEQLYYPTKQRLWRSINGGASWTPVSSFYNLTIPNSGIPYMDGNNKPNPTVYWAVNDTLWIKPSAATTPAGNEIKIDMPFKIRCVRVDPNNDSIVYITANFTPTGSRIYRSSNLFTGNVQWTDLTGDLPAQLFTNCIEVNPDDPTQMVLATNFGLYVTENGGQHWDRDMQLPNVNILRTGMRASDGRLFIYTYGRGAWAASFPGSNSVTTINKQTGKLDIWPNPARDVVHVSANGFTLNTSLRLLSTDGRILKTVNNIQTSPVAVNVSDLPPGTYVITLFEKQRPLRSSTMIKL